MNAPMERLMAALDDRYRIEREIGAGGMATVYLAVDQRHGRKVAVKVLRPELAAVVGAERFLAEIRVTANLQHPHILPLHDSGEVDGLLYYVMPFVEGESLRDRLARERQLSVEDALRITAEVADGLSHAHGLGVIHRDIKPANILLAGGHALLADFGIARAVSEAGGTRLTETGLSLGTPQYMSPEQASGDIEVDARSDEYSLACVLYEMLAGEAPHTGPNAQAILARVLTHPAPSITEARDTVPIHVDLAIRKALSKLPADRFNSVHRFSEATGGSGPATWDTLVPADDAGHRAAARRSLAAPMAWTLAAVLGVALAGSLFWPTRDTGSGLDDVVRMVLDPAPAGGISIGAADTESAAEVATLAISEDGLRIAFIGRVDGDSVTHLYLRDLGDFEARQLPGTEHATSPFFSPDGEWLGFYSWREGRLKRISVLGGEPQVVCTCEPILSATWGPDGIIVMDHHGLGGLRLVDASGGTPQPLAPGRDILEDDEHSLIHPQFLPDGRHVLVTAWGGAGAIRRIAAVSIDAGERTTLLEDGWAPQFVPSGHLVYLRTNQLWAAPLDAESLEVTGTAEPVVDSVFSAPFLSLAAISRSGTLVYAPGPLPDVGTSLYRVGRSGEEERLPGGAMTWSAWGPALAPDGRRIAFWGSDADGFSSGQGASRIWVYDPSQGRARAITDAGAGDFWPTWSADGREIAFTSLRSAPMGLYRVASDGSTSPESLLGYEGGIVQPGSWLSDGQGLIYQRAEDLESDFDIWLLPFEEDSDPVPLVQGPANEVHPALSPDSRWLAYASDQSGQYEVYLTPYPQLDRTLQVSRSGGMGPRWRSDSRELFFYAEGGQVSGWAASFMRSLVDREPSPPEALWSRAGVFSTGLTYGHGYDVTPGGETFIVALNESPPSLFLSDLHLVFNWLVELEARFED